jgi:hypothetical protein
MGLITALVPATRDFAVYDALADSPVEALKLSFTVTWMLYVPSWRGSQVKLLFRLKSRTMWDTPPLGATLNW